MNPVNQHIEFFQAQFRKPVIKLPLNQILWIWLGVIILWGLLSVIDYISAERAESRLVATQETTRPLEKVAAQLQAELDSLGTEDKSLVRNEEQLRTALSEKRRFLSSLKQQGGTNELQFSHFLNGLANIRSDALWLTRIQIKSPGPTLSLSGLANNAQAIPAYMGLFKEQPQFEGLGFRVFSVERPKSADGYLRFTVSTKHE